MPAFYEATEEDKKALQLLKEKSLALLGPSGLTFGLLLPDYKDPDTMVFGHIPFPSTERRLFDGTLIRYKKYYLSLSVYKVDSMPRQAYMIKFWRKVDMRLFRKKTWDEDREASKIFVYGDTPEDAFERFLEQMQREDYTAYDLADHPHVIASNYLNNSQG